MSEANTPRRLWQTDAQGYLVQEAIVHSSFLGDQELFPKGTRTATPLPAGPNQVNKTSGPGLDAPWLLVPFYVGFEYWLPDGSKHAITEAGVAPPADHLLAPPPPTPEQIQAAVASAVDRMLDTLAQSWRYRNYIRARSYRDDPNPRFAAEAATLIAHGSACWTVLDDLESAVVAGTAQMPGTVDQVLALLPPPPARPVVP